MVFASYNQAIDPLSAYLGDLRPYLDSILCNGRIEFLGHQRYRVKANWKLFIENTVDGYHPALLHRTIGSDKVFEYTPAHGHCRKFYNGHGFLEWPTSTTPESKWNEESDIVIAASRSRKDGGYDYSVNIFPNVMVLHIADIITVRQLIPRGINEVDVITFNVAREDDSPALKEHRAWVVSNQFGSAGVASIDDKFVMEAVQATAHAQYSDTLLLRRKFTDSVGELTTEISLRGFYEKWAECLNAP